MQPGIPSPLSEKQESKLASSHIAFSWLLHLRWGAFCAQALLVVIVYFFFKIKLPYLIILVVLLFEVGSNLYFGLLKQRESKIPPWLFTLVMFLDIALLTVLLFYSGGPMNPFTFLYLVHITLGAILMRPLWSYLLAVFTVGCYAALFYLPAHGSETAPCHPVPSTIEALSDPMRIHLQGMWVAFAITAFFIVFFVSKIQQSLARHQKTVTDLREEKMKSEKLASLATLAAGAAHEFSTPLATIAIAAGEMQHTLKEVPDNEELLDDVKLIRDQVNRCKDILYHMSADAGEHMGEEETEFMVDEFLKTTRMKFPEKMRTRIHFIDNCGQLSVKMPLRTLGRIVRGIIKNGLDASPEGAGVVVECGVDQEVLFFRVSDHGSGMAPEILSRATEPFFTTKEPGKGLGLGLFLAKSAAERFGGDILLESIPGKGSTVTIYFSLQMINAKRRSPA